SMTEMDRAKSGRAYLTDLINKDWSIFDELANLGERARRRILRSHREEPFTGAHDEETRLRRRLDDALDRLLLLELAVEVRALPSPPFMVLRGAVSVDLQMLRFLKSLSEEEDADVKTALTFLDGFVEFPDEEAKYELWLRGLLDHGAHDERFAQINRGLMSYA